MLLFISDCTSDPNAHLTVCGPFCVYTCQHPQKPGTGCIDLCTPGCFCNKGYTLDETTNKCVETKECPK